MTGTTNDEILFVYKDELAYDEETWLEMVIDDLMQGGSHVPMTVDQVRPFSTEEIARRAAEYACRYLDEEMSEDVYFTSEECEHHHYPEVDKETQAKVAQALMGWAAQCTATGVEAVGTRDLTSDYWKGWGLTVTEAGLVLAIRGEALCT